MSDRVVDPRFETLLRGALAAEVASVPLRVRPDQILERARVRDDGRVSTRLRRLVFGEPSTRLRLSLAVAVGAVAVFAVVAIAAVVVSNLPQRFDGPAVPNPSPSPWHSPRPGEATFTSTIHGISIDYPSEWQTKPATEPWTGGPLNFDSPAADVIFDPALGDRVYLILASQPYGDLSQDAWRYGVLAWTCPGWTGGEMWSWGVDGASAWQQAPCNSGSIIAADTRGYLIRLVASTDEPGLADAYDWDWLKPLLETVDLQPEILDGLSATDVALAAALPGDWTATDSPPDSSPMTMAVVARSDGSYDVTIRDESASVCHAASSTMTGVADPQESGTILIARPNYICDDGSESKEVGGLPLDERLRNLRFTYTAVSNQLRDSGGIIWSRAEPAQ